MAAFKILGTTQDVETCNCCGRTGLKKTVELGELDADGAVYGVVHYGVDCAAAALGYSKRGGKTAVENKVLNLTVEFRKAVCSDEILGRFVKQASFARKDGRSDDYAKWIAKIAKKGFTQKTVEAAYGWQ
jgi:hypothetical protein